MEVVVFPPNRGGAVVGHCKKYTVGHGVRRGGRPGCRPWSCGDRAGILPTPAGGVVVAVGCSVLQTWRSVGPAGQGPVCSSGGGARDGPGPPRTEWWRAHQEVRETRGGPGPLEGGGPGLQLRVLCVHLGGARGVTGPLPKQEVGLGPYV